MTKLNTNYINDDYFKYLKEIRTIDNKHRENVNQICIQTY